MTRRGRGPGLAPARSVRLDVSLGQAEYDLLRRAAGKAALSAWCRAQLVAEAGHGAEALSDARALGPLPGRARRAVRLTLRLTAAEASVVEAGLRGPDPLAARARACLVAVARLVVGGHDPEQHRAALASLMRR